MRTSECVEAARAWRDSSVMAALSLDVRDLLAAAWHVSTGSVTGSLCVTGCPQPLGPLTRTGERKGRGAGGEGGAMEWSRGYAPNQNYSKTLHKNTSRQWFSAIFPEEF